MGACCGTKSYTNNDAENFIRDVLWTIKLRNYTVNDLVKHYNTFAVTKHRKGTDTLQRSVTYDPEKYTEILHNIYYNNSSKNHYLAFHKQLAPKYDELFVNSPEYTFYTYGFSIVSGEDKHAHLESLLKSHTEFIYKNFTKFLKFYLEVNLITFTCHIVEALRKSKTDITIDSHYIDKDLIDKALELDHLYSMDKVDALANKVITDLENIMRKENKTLELREILFYDIKKKHLDDLHTENPWLFDVIQLRQYFWQNYIIASK